jgi:hypothetical protein
VPTGTSSDNELPTPVLVEKNLKKYRLRSLEIENRRS